MKEFSQDEFDRSFTNLHILMRSVIDYGLSEARNSGHPYIPVPVKQAELLSNAYSQHIEIESVLANRFSDQFRNDQAPCRVCNNPNCKSQYAYFYDDFLYCPRCGTKLKTVHE